MKLGKVRRAMMHESWYYRWRKPPKTPKIPTERAHNAPSSTRAAKTPDDTSETSLRALFNHHCREMAEGALQATKAMRNYKAHLAELKASSEYEECTPEEKRKFKSTMTMMRREMNKMFPNAISVTGVTQWSKVFAAAYGYLTAGDALDDLALIDRAAATLQDALDSGP